MAHYTTTYAQRICDRWIHRVQPHPKGFLFGPLKLGQRLVVATDVADMIAGPICEHRIQNEIVPRIQVIFMKRGKVFNMMMPIECLSAFDETLDLSKTQAHSYLRNGWYDVDEPEEPEGMRFEE